MQSLRPPWRRSRTPTPTEMRRREPAASVARCSLDSAPVSRQTSFSGDCSGSNSVPQPVVAHNSNNCSNSVSNNCSNSVSNTQHRRGHRGSCTDATDKSSSFLRLPLVNKPRSRSFDLSQGASVNRASSADRSDVEHLCAFGLSFGGDHEPGAALSAVGGAAAAASAGALTPPLLGMLRRSFSRHSSSSDRGSTVCVHCLCAEEYERRGCGTGAQLNPPPPPTAGHRLEGDEPVFVHQASVQSSEPADPDADHHGHSESDYSDSDSSGASGDDPDDSLGVNADEESNATCGTARLSFLGESFECRQKVEPWIQKNELAPESAARGMIRRGRSLGLACPSTTISEPNLRRGGSECRPDPSGMQLLPEPLQLDQQPKWRREECRISFNISLSSEPSTASSTYQTSAVDGSALVSGRRSPGGAGTPRLERQEALSGWMGLESEPSIDLLAPDSAAASGGHYTGSRQVSTETHTSMETHASASLEVDSGTSVQLCMTEASLESQNSVSLDVILPDSIRHPSLDSQTSVDSMASSIGRCSCSSAGSAGAHSAVLRGGNSQTPLVVRRKCLSAGASPSTSPPICLSNSRFGLCASSGNSQTPTRLNLRTSSSCEGASCEGRSAGSASASGAVSDAAVFPDAAQLSPSPPAEIYLTVPVLAPLNAQSASKSAPIFDFKPRLSPAASDAQLERQSSHSSSDKEMGRRPRCQTQSSRGGSSVASSGEWLLHPHHSELPSRSRSIEIGLPTAHRTDYHALAGSARRQQWVSRLKKNSPGEVVITSENGERRVLRSTPDWSDEAINADHLWVTTSASGDLCYVGDSECTKTGPRMKCSACRIVAHISCIPQMKFQCRPTFWDGDLRQYRENTDTAHHWVHRRSQTGKCKHCSKSFQSKLSFGSKEIVAISCSWCKAAFHNKDSCFNMERYKEACPLGTNSNIIVPPSWIVKLPARESFKSSLRKSPRGGKKEKGSTRRKREKAEKEQRCFVVKPIPSTGIKPIIVFINPKSGGNQGAKLMQKFQYLLNPRQVFDLTQGGPRAGLEMFRKVPNLRVLACGGDGTAGWVLSVLDQIGISPAPPVGVLPLGTGNDLARALGWGGGYTDEPISKILSSMGEGDPVMLDRWELLVEKNQDAPAEEFSSLSGHVRDTLPLSVVNNYFSFGVDAQIALDFHEAREARPQKFNSRLRNKMFYGQAGGKDLLQRKWKDLSEFVKIECDGKDITTKLRSEKVHAVLFLNIPSYGGGTHPWNRAFGTQEQATDDGLIEVVGLTTYQLPLLQAGGHGTCLAQCRTATITTQRTIPMQVDGEACRLTPSVITLKHLNRAPVLAKRRSGSVSNPTPVVEKIKIQVKRVSMADYETHHYDKEALQSAATPLGVITIYQDAVLERVRHAINQLIEQSQSSNQASPTGGANGNGDEKSDWCFVDCCTAERVFRVDMGQEHLHYITDISTDDLYILDQDSGSETKYRRNSSDQDPNGAAFSAEDAGLDDMVDLANRELQQHQRQTRNPSKDAPGAIAAAISSPQDPGQHNLMPVHIKSSPLLEKSSISVVKAAKEGDLKKVKELHASGFSLLSIDPQGQTALHWAARHGHRDVVKYLLASASTSLLDIIDNEKGQTALHKAAMSRQRAVCCMLVAAGASLTLSDRDNLTARQLAEKAGDTDLAIYLESQENFHKTCPEDVETSV